MYRPLAHSKNCIFMLAKQLCVFILILWLCIARVSNGTIYNIKFFFELWRNIMISTWLIFWSLITTEKKFRAQSVQQTWSQPAILITLKTTFLIGKEYICDDQRRHYSYSKTTFLVVKETFLAVKDAIFHH